MKKKILILWCLCEWWIETNNDLVQDLPPVRSLCLGEDSGQTRFWYFGDCRLYQEIPVFEEPKTKSDESELQDVPVPDIEQEAQEEEDSPTTPSKGRRNRKRRKIGDCTSETISSSSVSPPTAEISLELAPSIEKSLFSIQSPFEGTSLSSRRKIQSIILDNSQSGKSRRSSRLLVKEIVAQQEKEQKEIEEQQRLEEETRKKGRGRKRKRSKSSSTQLHEEEEEEEESMDTRPVPSSYNWNLLCSTLEDWEQFEAKLSASEDTYDQELYDSFSDIIPAVIEELQAKEKAKEKRLFIEALPRKRSARIFQKVFFLSFFSFKNNFVLRERNFFIKFSIFFLKTKNKTPTRKSLE